MSSVAAAWSRRKRSAPSAISASTIHECPEKSPPLLRDAPATAYDPCSLDRALLLAEQSGVLDLSRRGLSELPTIHAMTAVVRADLSHNRLSSLPSELTRFHQLETLVAGGNILRSLPGGCGGWMALRYLDLSSNQLTSLPAGLFSLPLEILLLAANRLEQIDARIGELAETLCELDVSCNPLRCLPASMGQLTRLRVLAARGCGIERIPDELALLPLHSLDVSRNELVTLPVGMRRCRSTLADLRLDENPLVAPPIRVCRMGREHVFKWLESRAVADASSVKMMGEQMNTLQLNTAITRKQCSSQSEMISSMGGERTLRRSLPVKRVEEEREREEDRERTPVAESTRPLPAVAPPVTAPHTRIRPAVAPPPAPKKTVDKDDKRNKAATVSPTSERKADVANNNVRVETRATSTTSLGSAAAAGGGACSPNGNCPPPSTTPPSSTASTASVSSHPRSAIPAAHNKLHRPVSKVAPLQLGERASATKEREIRVVKPVPPRSTMASVRGAVRPTVGVKQSEKGVERGGAVAQRKLTPPTAAAAGGPRSRTTTPAPSAGGLLAPKSRVAPAHTGPIRVPPRESALREKNEKVDKTPPRRDEKDEKPKRQPGSPDPPEWEWDESRAVSRPGKVEEDAAELLRQVMSKYLGLSLSSDRSLLATELCDGVALCRLANALKPKCVQQICTPQDGEPLATARARRNADSFIAAARRAGCRDAPPASEILANRNLVSVGRCVAQFVKASTA